MANATVMLSDPATCMAPNGPYEHVYVTITDVKASTNASAGDNDPSFIDLTPGLASAPKQIDLLAQATNQCFLASLGATQELPPGNYQQIRIILASNSANIPANACNGSTNCVVTSDGKIHPLLLSSESNTGIKIPSGQIASGGFNIAAGQTKDLDIDFNTCISIVQEGNGQFRLKPVLRAGEVSTTSTSINGVVVDSTTGKPVNGPVMVALEQNDGTGTDRVIMNTMTDATGGFVFCPVLAGTYDIVVVGESTSGLVYAPSVITGVGVGTAVSTISLYPQPATAVGPVTLQGGVTSQTATPAAGTAINLQLSALETINSALTVTVPLLPTATQSSATLALETAGNSTCPANTDCTTYAIALPAAAPYTGAFAVSGTTLTQSTPLATYVMDGIAVVPSSGGTPDCSVPELKSNAAVSVPGANVAVSTLAFSGCS